MEMNPINGLTYFPEAPVSIRQSHYNSRSTAAKTLSVPAFKLCSYQYSFFSNGHYHLEPTAKWSAKSWLIKLLQTSFVYVYSLIIFTTN